MNRFRTILLFLFVLLFAFACEPPKSNGFSQRPEEFSVVNQALSIDTFSVSPAEMDGCGCYFSNNAQELGNHTHIYKGNYEGISFMKINGIIMRFVRYEFQELSSTSSIARYRYGNYELKVVANEGERNGDETWLQTGTIELSNNKGEKLIRPFYGECGC